MVRFALPEPSFIDLYPIPFAADDPPALIHTGVQGSQFIRYAYSLIVRRPARGKQFPFHPDLRPSNFSLETKNLELRKLLDIKIISLLLNNKIINPLSFSRIQKIAPFRVS